MKPKPTKPKGQRPPETSEEWHKYIEHLALLEDLDWAHDCNEREYKKSEKYKQGQDLADKFKNKKKLS